MDCAIPYKLYCSIPEPIKEKTDQLRLIKDNHSSLLGGHTGVNRTIAKLKQRYVWKGMNKMVKRFIQNCEICKKNKIAIHSKEKMVITNTPSACFQTISIDTIGPLRPSNNFRYILTMQCDLTKYVEAFPMTSKESSEVAKTIVEKFILKYGHFNTMKTDMGSEFVNKTISDICTLLNIEHKTSTPYHHESLGGIERNHRVLKEYLLCCTEDTEWEKNLPYYIFSYNTTPHTSTNYTPFELIFGRLPTLPDNIYVNKPIYNLDSYKDELRVRLQNAHENVNKLLIKSKTKNKEYYDKSSNSINFTIGDLVLLRNHAGKKLDSPYEGPFKLIDRQGVNSVILYKGKEKLVHNNNLKPYN